jgi:hypothetical protein
LKTSQCSDITSAFKEYGSFPAQGCIPSSYQKKYCSERLTHPLQADAIVEAFREPIVEFHKLVGGRLIAIHDLFNTIGAWEMSQIGG